MSRASTYMRLEVISGNAAGDTLVVEDELVIGRHATGPGKLSEDEEISRQHARISRELTGDYAIEDLGSSNGTFVNGLRIQSSRLLELGDSIEAGSTTLVVREIVRSEPAKAAANTLESAAPDPRRAPTVFARSPVVEPAFAEPASAKPETVEPAFAKPETVRPVGRTPPLALELEIDFDARVARIALGSGAEKLGMVFEDGAWRVAPGGSS